MARVVKIHEFPVRGGEWPHFHPYLGDSQLAGETTIGSDTHLEPSSTAIDQYESLFIMNHYDSLLNYEHSFTIIDPCQPHHNNIIIESIPIHNN